MTYIAHQRSNTALDGRVAGVFNTVALILAGVLLFAAFVPA